MTISKQDVTAVILAGGKSSRMSGHDKGLLTINGETFIERIIAQLAPQCAEIFINANRNLSIYEEFGYTVIKDDLEDFQGPLAGILSTMRMIETDWLLTAPCDGPYLDHDYCEKLSSAVQENINIVVAETADRIQPVYALIHRSLTSSLQSYLESGERKIDRWYFQNNCRRVKFKSNATMFENINTPEQYSKIDT